MLRLLASAARPAILNKTRLLLPSVRNFASTPSRAGFWDNIVPLLQGNRRERQLQRKQGGLLQEDIDRVRRDQRRDELMASQSSTGDMLIDDAMDAPEIWFASMLSLRGLIRNTAVLNLCSGFSIPPSSEVPPQRLRNRRF